MSVDDQLYTLVDPAGLSGHGSPSILAIEFGSSGEVKKHCKGAELCAANADNLWAPPPTIVDRRATDGIVAA